MYKSITIPGNAVSIILLASVFLITAGCGSGGVQRHKEKEIEIRGIYGSPDAFWKKNIRLDSLNVNAIFLGYKSVNEKLMDRARQEGLKVFAEFPSLNGKGYVEEHPEAWAIDSSGKKVEPASWFLGVCPTEPGFKNYRMTELRDVLRKFDLNGIWLDYLHWHAQFEEPEPILPETCFCENCLAAFQSSSEIKVPGSSIPEKAKWILSNKDSEWREWRCSVIAQWAKDAKLIINQERPGAFIGIYHCPWNDEEFNNARYRILGLDYDLLKEIADVFSPMVYHGRMGREPEWVKENIEWFCKRLDAPAGSFPKVWPIVQAYDDPDTISSKEFEDVLNYGAGACATGVMMFTSNSVAASQEKTATMKRIYAGWKAEK